MPTSDRAAAGCVPAFTVDAAHRLMGACERASPHCDERPVADDISLLVIHAIALPPGKFGGGSDGLSYIDALFLGRLDGSAHPYFESIRELRVSAHLCIFRNGAVTQYVPFDRRAWHAGVSQFDGRSRCNDFAIGIELEGCDELPFTDAQYISLIAVTRALLLRYPALTPARIVGHCDIAPGRKTDPGPHFDWPRLRAAIAPEMPQ